MNDDTEGAVVSLLVLLDLMKCPGRIRIGHSRQGYMADVILEENGELTVSMETGNGTTVGDALHGLLGAMQCDDDP
ncbi:MAG: hypothetical protein HS104_11685 [Polyangiaceae bacterium]|nr:hypothetical protein [Polyangiaceae bacterium]MCL4748560.1 hypothetical protein [Myxococcales bacterium]